MRIASKKQGNSELSQDSLTQEQARENLKTDNS